MSREGTPLEFSTGLGCVFIPRLSNPPDQGASFLHVVSIMTGVILAIIPAFTFSGPSSSSPIHCWCALPAQAHADPIQVCQNADSMPRDLRAFEQIESVRSGIEWGILSKLLRGAHHTPIAWHFVLEAAQVARKDAWRR